MQRYFQSLYYFLFFGIFFFIPAFLFAQNLSNLRQKYISVKQDSTPLDTLSIIPKSVFVFEKNGQLLDTANYKIDYAKAILIWNKRKFLSDDSLQISYRVFPYFFSQSLQHKDIQKLEKDASGIYNPFAITYEKQNYELFKLEGLKKNGSISRGLSFGNNQDVVLNSSLNLQLSGKLSDNIDILAAITDENIPVQSDGNTKQLQEFDKVFIQLSNQNNKLIVGDFELKKPDSYFMNFYKKAQGASFTTVFNTSYDEKKKTKGIMKVGASAAISKGKFFKNPIKGEEGNQGPYRLRGANNELFIIVLSGSEKVFIDGQLLERGQQNDYVIDYNTAEISFTPKHFITKDSRIIVEFQYSDKNYVRSLFYFNDEYEQKNLKVKFNLYSEQDSKNQPLQQNLTDEQKLFLSKIGNNIDSAIMQSADSIAFNADQVLYKKLDTTITTSGIIYYGIYVYSTNSDSAHYRVSFSDVGQGNGNYVPENSVANGKVYVWIAPINGIRQGSYEPIIKLITPKKQQLYTLSADYVISKNTKATIETAVSNNDVNTFSSQDKKNNAGYAMKVNLENTKPLCKNSKSQIQNSKLESKSDTSTLFTNEWKLRTTLNYEYTNKNFKPIERYRSTEFERDWNVRKNPIYEDEHILSGGIGLGNQKTGNVNYQFKTYLKGLEYNAYNNAVSSDLMWKKFHFVADASLLNTSGTTSNTNYLRYKADLSKALRYFIVGAKEESEQNSFFNTQKDTLQKMNSFSFNSYEIYFLNPDTSMNKFKLFYSQRTDNAVAENIFKLATVAENAGISFEWLKNSNSNFRSSITYRKLTVKDTLLTAQKNDNTFLSRIEYNLTLLKGGITSNTFYEIGTGQEQKKEYAYLNVATGTGVYQWNDYNHNGIKELNEFETATFRDSANYVKIFVPTNEYVKAHTNQFNQVLFINPAAFMQNTKGIKNFISRFSNQILLRLDKKTLDNNLLSELNPFVFNISDSTLVSTNSSLRNTLYFNRSSSKFGLDINWQDARNKTLLTDGFESRIQTEQGGNIRWNITRIIGLQLAYKNGIKTREDYFFPDSLNNSKVMPLRNYSIRFNETEPKVSYQPSVFFRAMLSFKYTHKKNVAGETAEHKKIGTEIKYSSIKQETVVLRFNYISVDYNSDNGTSLAYEMLDGLQKGQNITWGASIQRNLSSGMQLSLNYDGRKSESIRAVHTGGVQLRAFF